MTFILEKSQRSPKDEYRYSNFPELATLENELGRLFTYMEVVQSALGGFYDNESDKINLNIAELRSMLALSYDITDVLGRAPNVCYDILMNVRTVQLTLNDLLYTYLSMGNAVVHDTNGLTVEEDENGGMI